MQSTALRSCCITYDLMGLDQVIIMVSSWNPRNYLCCCDWNKLYHLVWRITLSVTNSAWWTSRLFFQQVDLFPLSNPGTPWHRYVTVPQFATTKRSPCVLDVFPATLRTLAIYELNLWYNPGDPRPELSSVWSTVL